jgi:hypothetical protein
MEMSYKPRLVYFQYKYDEQLPPFVLIHKDEHVKCLSEFFDVTVIHHDCDYQQICNQYEPDLTLFESGVPYLPSRRPRITNGRACQHIPKIGLLHSDAFSEQRAGFLSDMDHLGIETFFAIATTAAEHTPAIAERLFVWPNFVDAAVYHDYGQWKNIPVLFTGNQSALYPWRQLVDKQISKRYPSMHCPHGGYDPRSATPQLAVGEAYARMINAAWLVPACGTAAKELIRKHIEVPACKACLITERSSALEAAGFIDMKNCVMADGHEIADKVAYLFEHTEQLKEIIESGYELAHSRHTLKHRDQIRQWFALNQRLRPHQQIIQTSPFEPMRIVDKSQGLGTYHIKSNGAFSTLLRVGDGALWSGRYDEAEKSYLRCLSYYQWMPEPRQRLALCNLYKGNPAAALEWIEKPISFTLNNYEATDPDPVEWAYFIISLLCLGRVRDAATQSKQFAWLMHSELDRARWAAAAASGLGAALPIRHHDKTKCRVSVHQMPDRSLKEWMEQLRVMLVACGQRELAELLRKSGASEPASMPANFDDAAARNILAETKWASQRGRSVGESLLGNVRQGGGSLQRQRLRAGVRERARRKLRLILHPLEMKYGYFLPHRLSASKHDELFSTIRDLMLREDVRTAVIIGASLSKRSTQALLASALENPNDSKVFCIAGPGRRSSGLTKIGRRDPRFKCHPLPKAVERNVPADLESILQAIKEEEQIDTFDFILVDGSELKHHSMTSAVAARAVAGAHFVVVDNTNSVYSNWIYGTLVGNPGYTAVIQNPALRGGYAIFEKSRICQDDYERQLQLTSATAE